MQLKAAFEELVKSILNNAAPQTGARPPAAVEISPEGVLAAALPGSGKSPVYAFQPLPEGAVLPGIAEANVRAPEVVSAAIREALEQVSPRSRFVTVIIPDTAVRVFVLDFDSLPPKAADVYPVLRFRLRKMVPFDVEHAGVSYQVLLLDGKKETKVLAAVLPGPVLAEYENAVRAAGYEPGAVLPSSLAALETVDSLEATLIANLSTSALTTLIATGQNLLLYRTLDLPEDSALRQDEVRRGVAVAAAFYEDKLGAKPPRLHFAGSFRASDRAGNNPSAGVCMVDRGPGDERRRPGACTVHRRRLRIGQCQHRGRHRRSGGGALAMRITLNLASRPFADEGPAIKRLRIAMGVLALLSLGFFLGLHAIHRQAEAARARDHSLDGQIATITHEREGYQAMMRQPANARLLQQSATLNKLIDEKAFSWTLAMEDLETVLPGGVQVTTLEPTREKDGHITVRLRVLGPRNRAVDLVHNLEHSKRFLLPRIVSENAEATGGPGQEVQPVSAQDRVNFDLLADYNPAGPEERKDNSRSKAKDESGNDAGNPTVHRPSRVARRPQPPGLQAQSRHRRSAAMSERATATWGERLRSPLTWHYVGFAILLVLTITLATRLTLDWIATNGHSTNELAGKQVELRAMDLQTAPLRGLDQRVALSRQQIEDFYAKRIPPNYSSISEQIGTLSVKSGARLSRLIYSQGPQEEGLTEISLDAGISGSYPDIMRFINSIERNPDLLCHPRHAVCRPAGWPGEPAPARYHLAASCRRAQRPAFHNARACSRNSRARQRAPTRRDRQGGRVTWH